jgi:antitoxin component YwqK of YwqJK toxin-antitoxin module
MIKKETARKYLQYFFFLSIALIFLGLYLLQKEKTQQGNNYIFPGFNTSQWRTDYYPDGKVRATGNTIGFEKDGKWIYYDTSGKVQFIEYYEKGRLIKTEHNN